jgi:hypothetical protein
MLVQLLGERERLPEVARDERVGEVVGARRRVGGGQPLDVGGGHVHRRMQGQPDLLELAREALLAWPDAPHQLLRRVGIELEPELAGVGDAPFRQLPGLGGGVLARFAAGAFNGLRELLWRFTAGNEDQDGFWRQLAERLLERAELVRLPCTHVVDEQVARGGVEAEHREGAGHLGGVALASVEQLEPAGPALLLRAPAHTRAPGVDLGVVVAADEVGGLQVGHAAECTAGRSRTPGPDSGAGPTPGIEGGPVR